MSDIRINANLIIPEDQLEWSFARSGGPGGQNVNKVNSKATLRWTPSGQLMSPAAWKRFKELAKRYFTKDGCLVIQSQEYRDQPKNVAACEARLVNLIRQALVNPKRRVKTKPSMASKRRRLDQKKRNSDKKRTRGRVDYD